MAENQNPLPSSSPYIAAAFPNRLYGRFYSLLYAVLLIRADGLPPYAAYQPPETPDGKPLHGFEAWFWDFNYEISRFEHYLWEDRYRRYGTYDFRWSPSLQGFRRYSHVGRLGVGLLVLLLIAFAVVILLAATTGYVMRGRLLGFLWAGLAVVLSYGCIRYLLPPPENPPPPPIEHETDAKAAMPSELKSRGITGEL